MEHRLLGKTGLQVPVVGMGTWITFDVRGKAALENARAVVATTFAAGANFFDSSPMYGQAEYVLSEVLRGRRDKALIATKVWAQSASEGRTQVERAGVIRPAHRSLPDSQPGALAGASPDAG